MDQQKSRGYALSLSNQVNMTNCYKHCQHFFKECKKVHFNVLIAYWMMAGYLGPVDSVEEAYQKGFDILLDLVYEKKIMKAHDVEHEMIEFVTSDSDPKPCGHEGFCVAENLAFVDLVDLGEFKNVVCTQGMLKSSAKQKQSMLLVDGNHLSRQVFHPPKRLKHLSYFNPRPNSMESLLKKVTDKLSVLVLRDCELLPQSDLPFEKFKTLTVLEISGSTHLTTIPEETISKMTQLRCLNLSDLLIEKFPDDFFKSLVQLRWVILRGLSKLASLPTIRELKNLEVFDLFQCTVLKVLKSNMLPNPKLQILDLSYTDMSMIPALKEPKNLTHLFLRDSKVNVLNSLRQLTSLLVLDLSGAQKVIEVTQLKGNKNLVLLDLSRTSTKCIDFLPGLKKLRNLILQECTDLGELPAMKNLTSLEVLDISGCEKLENLPEDLSELQNLKELSLSRCSGLQELREGLFDQMSCLQTLDLSWIKVNHIPSFAKLTSLCKLFLRGLELNSLEIPASFSNLVELDLKGLKIRSEFTFDFIQTLEKLRILIVSQTSVAKLPSLSKLTSLRELILADCRHLKTVPRLQTLTNLVALDLSLSDCSTINNCKVETEIEGQIGVYSCLRNLVLTNRYGVQKLFPLTSLGDMDNLDLCGTDVTEIPYEVMAQVKCIQLPATVDLSGFRLSRMGLPQEVIDWNDNPREGNLQGRISKDLKIKIAVANGSKSTLSAGANQFFHLKEGNQGTWEAFIHKFPVFLPPKESKDKVMHLDGDEFILRDDLSWARRLLDLEMKDTSVDIWNERRDRSVEIHGFSELRENIKDENIQTALKQANNLAFVGNDFSCSLSDVCSKEMEACCIRRCLNMNSVLTVVGEEENEKVTRCPKRLVLSHLVDLEFICAENVSSENIKSLQHIHIDCCPKLTKVIAASQVPPNLKSLRIKFCDRLQTLFKDNICLLKLQRLSLFELPKLEGVDADIPNLQSLSISQCPKVKNLDGLVKSASASLMQLSLDSSPCLEHVLPSLPVMQKLKVLKIRSCNGLVTLFDKLEGIEADLPELQTLSIGQCPKLKNLDRVVKSASTSLTQLCLDSCPCLEHVLPSSPVLQNLEVLKISSCSGLVTLFDKAASSSTPLPKLEDLQTLRLWNLPKLNGIGGEISLLSTPELDPCLPPSIKQHLTYSSEENLPM